MKVFSTLFILALSFVLSAQNVDAAPIPNVHEVVDPNDMMRRYEETQLGADVFRRRISGLERRMVAVEQERRRRSALIEPVLARADLLSDLVSSASQLGGLTSGLTSSVSGVANVLGDTTLGSIDSSSSVAGGILGSTGSIADSQGGLLGNLLDSSASSIAGLAARADNYAAVVGLNSADDALGNSVGSIADLGANPSGDTADILAQGLGANALGLDDLSSLSDDDLTTSISDAATGTLSSKA